MQRGATGDPGPRRQATGIVPRDLEAALASEPASVQEHWFRSATRAEAADIRRLRPVLDRDRHHLARPGWDIGMYYVREGGLGETLAAFTVVAGALANLAIGLAILWRPASRYGLWVALIITLTNVAIGTMLVPRLWADPLGPMLKIWPVLMLNLVAMAIREDR
jgi:hypothetical protein